MNNNAKGVSLIELLVAIVIAGILAVIAFPSFQQWRQSLEYKEAARDVASILRDARARAISRNLSIGWSFNLSTGDTDLCRATWRQGVIGIPHLLLLCWIGLPFLQRLT